MTTTHILMIVAVVSVIALVVLIGGGRGGPRVTVIETKKERDGEPDA